MSDTKKHARQISRQTSDVPAWLAFAVLAAAICAVYSRALDAPFLFDDSVSVLTNRSIRTIWPLVGDAEQPGPLNPPIEIPTSARPLVNLSLAVNFCLGELDPRGYRAVNIALHICCAMLLWAIVRRALRLPHFGGRFDRAAGALALAVAIVWAVHPLTTEAVAYITQRTELMVALFYLATLYCSLRYWDAATPSDRTIWLVLATLAALAGAASKEVMVTSPLIVLLFERTFVGGTFREALRRSWPLYTGLLASWALLLTLQLNGPRGVSAGFGIGEPVIAWWCTQTQVFAMYLKLAVWPSPLLLHYELPHREMYTAAWLSVAFVGAFAIATLVLLWRRNAAGFLFACVLVILAPTHLVPIVTEIAAERRMYLPLSALVALAVVGGYSLLERLARPMSVGWPLAVTLALSLFVAVVCGIVSVQRLGEYQDLVALWQTNVAVQPYNHVAQTNLANALASVGRRPEAIEHYRTALEHKTDFEEARYNLGLALAAEGRLGEAIEQLRELLRQKPDAYRIRNNLGVVLFTAGRYPEAIVELEKTLEIRPDFVEAQENLNRARQASVLPKEAQ